MLSKSAPVRTVLVFLSPTCWPIASAVLAWSPVIIFTWMPALWHWATDVMASGRGGSINPTIPSKIRSCSTSENSRTVWLEWIDRTAKAKTRWPLAAMTSSLSSQYFLFNGSNLPSLCCSWHIAKICSGAPFTKMNALFKWLWCKVAINRCRASNGIVSVRVHAFLSSCKTRSAFPANANSAPSMGSPSITQWPSCSWSEASLQRMAARASSSSGGCSLLSIRRSLSMISPTGSYPEPSNINWWALVTTDATDISLSVRVPVLSVHITETEPSVSIVGKWRTIACRRAIARTPIANVMEKTVGSPSGIAATDKLTTTMNNSLKSWCCTK